MQKATKKNTKRNKRSYTLDVAEKIFALRKALAAYVDVEIARCGNPPNPAMVHSDVARVLLYCQVEALNKIDAWVDAAIGKRKKEA